MGHLHTDISVRGSKKTKQLKNVQIDTGATFTVLPQNTLEEIGAWGPIWDIDVGLGNGPKVKAKAYGVTIKIEGVEAPAIGIMFEGAQTAIGVETLESIGLKLDPTTGKSEFTRPKGIAYF
jgi:predicted aspartyl protease